MSGRAGSEGDGDAAEDGDAGLGIAEHSGVVLVEQVGAAKEHLQPIREAVGDTGLEVDVIGGDGRIARGEVEVADSHGSDVGAEAAGMPVGTGIQLMDRGAGVDGVHMQEAIVGIEAELLDGTPVGAELHAFVRESADVAVLRLAVLADHFDDVRAVGVEEAQFGIELSVEEMVSEGEIIAPGLLREEFCVGGSVHIQLPHVWHTETLGSRQL